MKSALVRASLLRKWRQTIDRCVPPVGILSITSQEGSNSHSRQYFASEQTTTTSAGMAMAMATVVGFTAMATATTLCEDDSTSSTIPTEQVDIPTSKKEASTTSNIPLWPNGVSEEDVDALVQEMLDDPSINLSLVPDVMEARIYKSTIQLTLNVFYSLLASLDGMSLLSHEFQLTRRTKDPSSTSTTNNEKQDNLLIVQQSKYINDHVLEQVADRMLANPTINNPLIPDAVERQVYVNCLKVIFRVLNILTNSFRITICGHDIRLALEPAQLEALALHAASRCSSTSCLRNMHDVDMDLLLAFAQDAGIPTQDHSSDDWSVWERLTIRPDFVAHLHASLYGLILGILDDILANTKIQILSDDIDLDIVPAKAKAKERQSPSPDEQTTISNTISGGEELSSASVGSFAAASFAAGVGMGVALMAIYTDSHR
jgi:hypothetical protein